MQYLTFLYPLLAVLLWAGNVIASRLSAHVIGPQAMTFFRLVLAVALMSCFVLVPAWRNRNVIWPLIGKLGILGFLAMCLFQSLSYLAAETTTATNMAIFTALIPLLTATLSVFVLGETPTVGIIGGGILSLAGLIYLVSGGDPGVLIRQGVHLGDLLMLTAAAVYALYSVLVKHWRLPLSSWQSTYLQALCALTIMFPAFLATPATLRQIDSATLPLIAYAGGLASVVLPFFWLRGIEHLGPNRCAIFMNLLPLFTALGAILLLGEPIRAYHLIGGGITLAGVAFAQFVRKPLELRRKSKSLA
jgi:drug/metabolite transporter (DMT)-like permease